MPGTRNGHGAHAVAPRNEPPAPIPATHEPASGMNVGGVERAVSAGAGLLLALLGLTRRTPLGLVVAAVGAGLVYRGVSGHCPLYNALDIDTSGQRGAAAGVAPGHGVHVIRSVTIARPAEELYAFWRKLENLPRFMKHLVSVAQDGPRSQWVAHAPFGQVTWEADLTHDEPGRAIGWRSRPGSTVATEGSVKFYPATGGGTVVRVDLRYDPPGGTLGAWLAWLFGEEPSLQVAEDLGRFKRLLESGEVQRF